MPWVFSKPWVFLALSFFQNVQKKSLFKRVLSENAPAVLALAEQRKLEEEQILFSLHNIQVWGMKVD